MVEKLFELQNGTDIRGIAIESKKKDINLTVENIKRIIGGFVIWLEARKSVGREKLKIAVGMDSRLSGPKIKEVISRKLSSLGCTVYDCGLCTTPAMFMTTVHPNYKCHGSIMITASHLPYYYNGLKFFTEDGGCEKEDIKYILTEALKDNYKVVLSRGKILKMNFINEYSQLLIGKIRKGISSKVNYDRPLAGLKVIVDAGNGAGGFFTGKVLEPLGADTHGSQFINPDGKFPNHIPNPEAEEAMKSIKNAVIKNKADMGIVFDADVDRAAIVDDSGKGINRNILIALASSIVLEEHPGTTVVTDSVTSKGLSEFIQGLGGKHYRFKRGYRNVINQGIKLNQEGHQCFLAIETSGHAALKENYFLDDGAYLVSKILIKTAKLKEQGKNIESLIEGLKIPLQSLEFRFPILKEDFKEYGSRIIENLKEYIKKVDGWEEAVNNYEGIRVECGKENGDGWFLLRLSLHEPVLCLNIESDAAAGSRIIVDRLRPFFIKYEDLNSNSFK
ncbi:phosphomannomutase/phosphoglucomutase [Clostridium luticellarii]|nr:phosphomannomutase/phosphoglucomutase [Clostridium luticellarii]MCI1944847.1 phosphomannomutase/phosphoglucomutase [Clostridium luticellarii]MCI1968337.1 phosphomannomutase/phosphoglucomutase [Clostridium luticellarii]MCI1995335.1 phosphomannomutase/phosphoglucomutase [Clostridium luticellarii]MCI2039403.1 phosphomannomutase/phosphoglucomutase [Clostridium luticellarii]